MQNQRRQLIQEYQQRINALDKPKMRITDNRQKKLHRGAIIADIADAAGGLLPVIGDAAMPFGTYEVFKYWFRKYDVEASEFLDAGGGGKTGKITTWILDFISGLIPVLGDAIDLLFASWYFTIRSTTKEIRKKDKKKIKEYKQKVRQLKAELRYQLAQISNQQQSAQNIQGSVNGRRNQNGNGRRKSRPIPSQEIRERAKNVASTQYNKRDTS